MHSLPGLTLAEIRQVLAISDTGQPACARVTNLIHQRLADVDRRLRDLETRSLLDLLAKRAVDQDPTGCDGYCAILQPPKSINESSTVA